MTRVSSKIEPKETQLSGFVATQEQIAEWKKKHGDVFEIECDGKRCYLKKPDRKILGAAASLGKNNPLAFSETLLANCWLAGDEEIKTDDSLFMSVSATLGDLVELKQAELKKL